MTIIWGVLLTIHHGDKRELYEGDKDVSGNDFGGIFFHIVLVADNFFSTSGTHLMFFLSKIIK
jgi:hypothetical protein